ncbi:MAG TPA: GntR family transcriptional regulator [Sphingomonas sp.]|nr:GntR family transcriptional regulator [Sphingomonas sp.]
MNSGATAERVYDVLKHRLLSGTLMPGEKLEPTTLADELNSSATPVRDALHRLTGERLVETRASEGFHLPHIHEPALRDLYAWNAQLLRMMIRSWPRDVTAPSADDLPIDLERATPAFFALFAVRTGNIEFVAQIDAANDRLSAVRAAESHVLGSLEDELRALAIDFDHGGSAALAKRVTAYHRRRTAAVPDIVRALYGA